jgi:Domain of unknown function (DUF4375)
VGEALELADKIAAASGHDALPKALRTAQLIGWLDFEVNLGGIIGWLTNSSGCYAPETADALDRIGAYASAEIVRKALAFSEWPSVYR